MNGTPSYGIKGRAVVETLRSKRGGFLCPFSCGWFIREFLLGNGTNGSLSMDPDVGVNALKRG